MVNSISWKCSVWSIQSLGSVVCGQFVLFLGSVVYGQFNLFLGCVVCGQFNLLEV